VSTQADLNHLEQIINILARGLRPCADFIMKIDTDEFIAVKRPAEQGDRSKKAPMAVDGVRRAFNLMPLDGHRCRIAGHVLSTPPETCDDIVMQSSFFFPVSASNKVIMPAVTMQFIDLGGHYGEVSPAGLNSLIHDTDIITIHFHNTCYDTLLELAWRAVVSHGYFAEHASRTEIANKCAGSLRYTSLITGRNMTVSSHKVELVCEDARDPVASRAAYMAFGKGPFTFSGLKSIVRLLIDEFDDAHRQLQ
jgi:hypothetical protein